jgi:hypothetical protein
VADGEREWAVTRRGGTIYVDLSGAGRLSGADTESILAAAEHEFDHDVRIVQVHGPQGQRPFSGLGRTTKAIYRFAERYDKQLVFGPI